MHARISIYIVITVKIERTKNFVHGIVQSFRYDIETILNQGQARANHSPGIEVKITIIMF